MNRKAYITFLLPALLLAACSSDVDEPAPVKPQVALSFSHSVEAATEADGSRAGVIEKDDIESFHVYGALYENNHIFKGYLFKDERAIPATKDNTWVTEKLYYWPDKTFGMSFVAYSPEYVKGLEVYDIETDPYNPRFMYEPPADPKEQVDLLFASTNPYNPINYCDNPGVRVDMNFQHCLMQVYFDIRGDGRKLKSITLKNVFKKAILDLRYSHLMWHPWNIENNNTSYTINVPEDGVLGDEHRLMIIPQYTSVQCTIDIAFRDGTSKSIPFSGKFETNAVGKVYRIILNMPE